MSRLLTKKIHKAYNYVDNVSKSKSRALPRRAFQREVFLCRLYRQSCSERSQSFTHHYDFKRINPLAAFSLIEQLCSEQYRHCSKSKKKKCRSAGSLNRCAIQYEVSVSASHLPKHSHLVSATVDETFPLLTASVRAQRAKPLTRNRLAVLPEKDSLYQSFRQAFFKRPRSPRPPRSLSARERSGRQSRIARGSRCRRLPPPAGAGSSGSCRGGCWSRDRRDGRPARGR